MIVYGFWFYEELVDKVGITQRENEGSDYIILEDARGNIFDVKAVSYRLELFKQNPKCVACHRVGNLWVLEAHRRFETPHLNLYHIQEEEDPEWKKLTKDGLVLMTKDHIIPRSKGGPTTLENLQTMCSICNGKKGNTYHGANSPRRDPIAPIGMAQNILGKIQFC
jgi:5-methylcytosine-specific restriction endonuclease McrA